MKQIPERCVTFTVENISTTVLSGDRIGNKEIRGELVTNFSIWM